MAAAPRVIGEPQVLVGITVIDAVALGVEVDVKFAQAWVGVKVAVALGVVDAAQVWVDVGVEVAAVPVAPGVTVTLGEPGIDG